MRRGVLAFLALAIAVLAIPQPSHADDGPAVVMVVDTALPAMVVDLSVAVLAADSLYNSFVILQSDVKPSRAETSLSIVTVRWSPMVPSNHRMSKAPGLPWTGHDTGLEALLRA